MKDTDIVDLYLMRNEQAIAETSQKYDKYCYAIAYNILHDNEDAKECVNDTYLGAWNSIPPHRPEHLPAFLGKITRNLSLKKWRGMTADKRGGGEQTLVLDELTECIPTENAVDRVLEEKELAGIIDAFLRMTGDDERRVFICRYWYMDSINNICRQFGFGQSKVKMMLSRTRHKLLKRLEEEGVTL